VVVSLPVIEDESRLHSEFDLREGKHPREAMIPLEQPPDNIFSKSEITKRECFNYRGYGTLSSSFPLLFLSCSGCECAGCLHELLGADFEMLGQSS
jgi:hypothetical protein